MNQSRRCRALVGVVLALCGCGQGPGDPAVVARVGEVHIVADDLQRLAQRLAALTRGSSSAEVKETDLVQTLIDREVLLLEARQRGLEGDSLVLVRLSRYEEEGLVREMLQRRVTARLAVSADEVEREYEHGGFGEETKSMEIFVSDEGKAKVVLEALRAGGDFGDLGRRYSEDRLFKVPAGAPQVSSYAPKDAPRGVVEAVVSLPVGSFAGPIPVDGGYVFTKALERRQVPLDEARPKVVDWLTRTKREALRDVYYISLQQSLGLKLNPDGMNLVVRRLEERSPAEALTADQQRLAVYTYQGGALDVEDALAAVVAPARSWPRIDESLVAEELRKVLRQRLVVLDARSQGVDRAEGFRQWVHGKQEDLMISRLRALVLEDQVAVSEDEVRSRYEESKERFRRPAIARVLDLLVEDPEQARALRRQVESGADMRRLIAQYGSRQNTRDGEVQVHDLETGLYGEAWLKAVMGAPLNELQGPIATEGGYSVFKVLEREASGYHPVENPQVHGTVTREVKASKEMSAFNEFLEGLRKTHADQVEVYDGNLERWAAQRAKLEPASPLQGSAAEVDAEEEGGDGTAP